MRRRRVWLLVAAALAALVVAALLGLPALLRWTAIRYVENLTGRRAELADVNVNLFTRRLTLRDLRVAGAGQTPLARLARLEARFHLLPLVRGRLYLDRLRLVDPAITLVRAPDGTLAAEDVWQRLRTREVRTEPPALTIEHFSLDGGRVVYEDRAVEPARAWRLENLSAEARRLTTMTEAAEGTLRASFVLAGAPGTVEAEHIGLRPSVTAVARTSLEPVDLAPLAAYMRGSPVVLTGGRLAGTQTIRIAEDALIIEHGRARVTNVVLARAGQDEPILAADAVVMRSHDIRWQSGQLVAGRFELTMSPTLTEAVRGPPRRYEVRDLHLIVEEARYPKGRPGRVTVTADLPSGGTLEARGTARLQPFSAEGTVQLARIDLALAKPYLPPAAPMSIDGGRLAATVDVSYAAPARLALAGEFGLRNLLLLRRGQRQPFIRHPHLRGIVTGLLLDDGDLTVERLALSGSPTVVDASVSPPQRFDVKSLSLVVEDAAWPARRAAKVQGSARLGGGASARLRGEVNPATLRVDAEATFANVDLRRFRGYLREVPVALLGGTAEATIQLTHDRDSGIQLGGQGEVRKLALGLGRRPELTVNDQRLAFTNFHLRITDGAVGAGRVVVTGAPTIVDRTGPSPRPVALRGLTMVLEDATWPSRAPVRARVAVLLTGRGHIEARGAVDLRARTVRGSLAVSDAALAPYAAFSPTSAPLGGRLDAEFSVRAQLAGALRVQAAGQATARHLRLGPAHGAPITAEQVQATGIEISWPERLQIDRIVIAEPRLLVERTKEGRFPLGAMLAPADDASDESPTMPLASRAGTEAGETAMRIAIGEVSVEQGQARFVDRTTTPFYSEELTDLTLRVRHLGTARERPGQVDLRAILGAAAALELHGVVEPFGQPFFLEVEGELRRFSLPRTNPYLRRFLHWIVRRGELTTKLHYRITGTSVEATNDIVVRGIDVERASGDTVGRALGLPLALIVSILKNPSGDIRLSIPISGELGSPRFSFRDAIATALGNLMTKVVTGPFAAIGRIVRPQEEQPARIEVEPVEFPPGGTTVGPAEARHLQRVADFLRASPYVGLTLQPVVTEADLTALRARRVAARIQQLQGKADLGFPGAAIRLYRRQFPDRPVPTSVNEIVDHMQQAELLPPEEAEHLARRRLEAARHHLVRAAGIERGRLGQRAPAIGTGGAPRVEFTLTPG